MNNKRKEKNKEIKIENNKLSFNYFIEETYECGMDLLGTEVKSIRNGKANINNNYLYIKDGELFLKEFLTHSLSGGTSKRDIKIFLHKKEILFLKEKTKEGGFTIAPRKIYNIGNLIKLEMALCKGKKKYDKKEDKKQKDIKRDSEITIKRNLSF